MTQEKSVAADLNKKSNSFNYMWQRYYVLIQKNTGLESSGP